MDEVVVMVADPQRIGVGCEGDHLVDPGEEPRWEKLQ